MCGGEGRAGADGDDGDSSASPLIDADSDGWSTCPSGSAPADCDDTDDEVNPNEPDTPYDAIDNDLMERFRTPFYHEN